MNTNLPQLVAETLYGKRIVEVFGIFRVNGAGPHIAEVFALGKIQLRYLATDLVGSLLYFLRVFIGQSVLREDGMHLDIIVASLSEYVYDFADEILVVGIRPLGDPYQSTVVGLSSLQLLLGDEYVVNKKVLLRDEKRYIFPHFQTPDERIFLSLQNVNDHCLFDMSFAASHELYPDTVAVECCH